ncbi:MAG: hypothetical protein H0X62_14325 [Bacteroidetes bacterium]|nr:hypothetical protein [Bacteroidota bacterium]
MRQTRLALAALLFVAVTFTSCKGDYTCDCGAGGSTDMKDWKKKDAKESCDAASNMLVAFGEAGCTLKKS